MMNVFARIVSKLRWSKDRRSLMRAHMDDATSTQRDTSAEHTRLHRYFLVPDMTEGPLPPEDVGQYDPKFPLKSVQFDVPVAPKEVIGKTITDVRFDLGTYGFGTFGFIGFRLDHGAWLVIACENAVRQMVFGDAQTIDQSDAAVSARELAMRGKAEILNQPIRDFHLDKAEFHVTLQSGSTVKFDPRDKSAGQSILTSTDNLRHSVGLFADAEIWTDPDEMDQ